MARPLHENLIRTALATAGCGEHREGLVLYFMRAGTCAICLRDVRALAGLDLAGRDVAAAVDRL
ncbi:hypothetical protein [Dactylosporangium sp. CA-139066]|uniref:hypothetical protein n=1 Tax=Dactylosporangium sp. CA-139066 TaxID=3239930 RepID=UPI003D8FE6F0